MPLDYNTQYYARVKHIGTEDPESSWSSPVAFTTLSLPLPSDETTIVPLSYSTSSTTNEDKRTIVTQSSDGIWMAVSHGSRARLFIYKKIDGVWVENAEISIARSSYVVSEYVTYMTRDGEYIYWFGGVTSGSAYADVIVYRRTGDVWSHYTNHSYGNQNQQNAVLHIGDVPGTLTLHTSAYGVGFTIRRWNGSGWTNDIVGGSSPVYAKSVMSLDGKTLVLFPQTGNSIRVYRRTSLSSAWVLSYSFNHSPYREPQANALYPAISGDGKYLVISDSWYLSSTVPVVRIYHLDTSSAVSLQDLQDTNAQNHYRFGSSMCFSDDGKYLAVSGGGSPNGAGVYIYVLEGSTWVFKTKLVPSDFVPPAPSSSEPAFFMRPYLTPDGEKCYIHYNDKLYIFE